MKKYYILLIISWSFALSSLYAQSPLVFQRVDYSVRSTTYDGSQAGNSHARSSLVAPDKEDSYQLAYQTPVTHVGTSSIRIFFGACHLGKKSYLTIISVKDGAQQRLDAESLQAWNHSSGYFNGESVILKLYVHSKDTGVYIKVDQLLIAEKASAVGKGQNNMLRNEPIQESLCGVDNRFATTDRAVGRLNSGSDSDCTVYITSNGSLLTAGHCRDLIINGFDVVEFDVPLSDSDGTVNHPPINSQYPINAASIRFENGGTGNDWCVFRCNNNNNGLTPAWGQQSFFRLSNDFNPTTVRITGCGIDGGAANQTLQTHTGGLISETVDNANDIYYQYTVDTEGGNSGSPIIWEGTRTVLGIHTHGGCTSSGGGNAGTSFEADDVEAAINLITSSLTVHVDQAHPSSFQSNSIMRPFKTVGAAIASAPTNALLSIAPGAYRETITLRNVTLQAPVGEVVIGPDAVLSLAARIAYQETNTLEAEATSQSLDPVEEFTLTTVDASPSAFPNPFTEKLTIQYYVKEKNLVELAVYDLIGNLAAHIVKQQIQDIGYYQAMLNSSQLHPGVYIYQLRIGAHKYMGKVIKK